MFITLNCVDTGKPIIVNTHYITGFVQGADVVHVATVGPDNSTFKTTETIAQIEAMLMRAELLVG